VVFSASLEGARRFSALLREGKIRKQYLALVEGSLTEPGIWEDPLLRDRETRKTAPAAEGKTARTRFSPLAPHPAGAGGRAGPGGRDYSLLVMEPETGRTHQIRAHAAAHGHPLGGDAKYGGKPLPSALLPAAIMPPVVAAASPGPPAFLLHAWKLLPLGNAGGLPPLEAPPPDYFLAAVEKIFGRGIISRQRLD
jgi:23S rRNA pseudouridine955/2504/2580 synthase